MVQTTNPPYSSVNLPRIHQSPAEESDTPGIFPYLHIIRKRKWLLIVAVSFCLFIALFVNVTQRPVFRAITEVVIDIRSNFDPAGRDMKTELITDPTLMPSKPSAISGDKA